MKKKYTAMILALPTLAVLVLGYFTLVLGEIFLFCVTLVGIPAYAWILLGVAGYGTGVWLLLTSQLCSQITLGTGLAALPILIIVLAHFFAEYHGP
ncbi:MAG: hypothetical protein FWH21_04990 [Kiritimatiellaeota bacterium]|nr:hypothetical protein [Kiritimatiellota bacterium]